MPTVRWTIERGLRVSAAVSTTNYHHYQCPTYCSTSSIARGAHQQQQQQQQRRWRCWWLCSSSSSSNSRLAGAAAAVTAVTAAVAWPNLVSRGVQVVAADTAASSSSSLTSSRGLASSPQCTKRSVTGVCCSRGSNRSFVHQASAPIPASFAAGMPITVEARYHPHVANLMVTHAANKSTAAAAAATSSSSHGVKYEAAATAANYQQQRIAGVPLVVGHDNRSDPANLLLLAPGVRAYVEEAVRLCRPDEVYVCDGGEAENARLLELLEKRGTIEALPKYENCWLARTNPADVARVESRTFISTTRKEDTVPTPRNDIKGTLGNWISPSDMDTAIMERFPNCMKGRTMYVIPFSMGPVGSPLSKIGIELTDSAYVVCSMRVMTRIGEPVLRSLLADQAVAGLARRGDDFVKCLHSVGAPKSRGHDGNDDDVDPSWPCDPERTIILHKPERNEIVSYGSGYGGNSLLGKKCFALRIGSTIARDEGWLAEHMLILGVTDPRGKKRYVCAAFPSACGKTNLAMLKPTLPGYKIECVGDDIAWMRFDAEGRLRAINPENGFFGVAPGTSTATNPHAMATIFRNTIFTNVAKTSDGGVYWEGMESELAKDVQITDWRGNDWQPGSKTPAAHPNSRFCSPASQCPIIDPAWEDPEGVPIDAILFGGRRPEGVPLIYQARDWQHGVFIGATMRSEATAAAEHKGKVIMNDPFAMRPFFGYNFGRYLEHWLGMPGRAPNTAHLPAIFHVNWFRKSVDGHFLWPGYGENCRVLDWILRRIEGEDNARESAIGLLPKPGTLRMDGLGEEIDHEALFELPGDFWRREAAELRDYLEGQVGVDLPEAIVRELEELEKRVEGL